MRKGPSRSGSARHQQFRARAKTRVDDLQDMFSGLQYARKEARSTDAVLLEAQLHQMLREWRAELSVPSPASSLQENNNRDPSDPPSETPRPPQLAPAEEEDDATSKLVEQKPRPSANQAHKHAQGDHDMKPEPHEEAIADPVTVAQQPTSLGPGVVATGGEVLTPATAVFHDQVVLLSCC
ncbi:unnamed protein product [Triticum turgidum subsp. durum]|uniref:Transcription factor VOZ1 n=1 Tax=Triticum turgidum subsp. durum TaxID=4567 RepID=A0A9R1QLT3_TRITD|nr:unnamed protein product [Triticum turgidum subsp. durum]